MIAYTIPNLRLVNIANARMHWAQRAKLMASHRIIGRSSFLANADAWRSQLPLTITIVRLGVRDMDSDGLAISGKGLRDGIADAIGCDDNDPRLTWEYRQERAPKGMRFGVRVEIRRRGEEAA